MALKKLLNKGTVYKRNDNRWGGMVSYHDEQGMYRRKSFCAPTKNGIEDKNGNLKTLTVRQVADLLGHTTSSVTEKYYVRREPNKLCGITDKFEL